MNRLLIALRDSWVAPVTTLIAIGLSGCAALEPHGLDWHNVVLGHSKLSAEYKEWESCVQANKRSPDYPVMMRACLASCAGDVSARTIGADGDGGGGCASHCGTNLKYTACGTNPSPYGFEGPGPPEPHGFAYCAHDGDHYAVSFGYFGGYNCNQLPTPAEVQECRCGHVAAFERSGPCNDPKLVVVARRYMKLPPRADMLPNGCGPRQ